MKKQGGNFAKHCLEVYHQQILGRCLHRLKASGKEDLN
jgi:hypothetical protein